MSPPPMEKAMSPTKKLSCFRRFGPAGDIESGADRLVIRVPDPRLLRLVARSVLLAAAILSFQWICIGLLRDSDISEPSIVGKASFTKSLLGDLIRRGLLHPDDNAIFLNDAAVGARSSATAADGSADFVFSAFAANFEQIDRILKVGGVAVVRLGNSPSERIQPPENYRKVYVGRIGSTAVLAMKKTSLSDGRLRLRRLLTTQAKKKAALSGLEGALLEPPVPGQRERERRAKYLPDLTGDELDGYPRRVFVEVAPAGEAGSGAEWFERNYPTKGRAFEVIRVEVKDEEQDEAEAEEGTPSLAEWLERNVKEEEYVVVKAEAAAVEEAVAEGAIGLVDELFLECDHQMWGDEEEKGGRRAYWECLALYGKLRDAGVAVHQWWSF